ncbi:MAG TPA: PAS domain-containing protein [Chloroflexota bacterium]|nr:PAS domain-containing protein [Chloroflexota bacterium]
MQSARSLILVVEDNTAVRETLRALLVGAGYAVACAVNGRAALDRVAAGGVDLVLLDLVLPEIDGVELCRQLRARSADEGYLPILMLTALSGEAERRAGFAAGADDYVAKPFEPADLLDRVAVWVRTRARLVAAHARVRASQAQEERLLREAEARTRTFRVLHEIAVAVGGVLDPVALAQLAVDRTRDLLGVDSVSLWWWDAEAAVLRRLAGHVPYPQHAPSALGPGQGVPGIAFARGAPVVVDDYPAWEHAVAWATAIQLRAAAAVPILVGERAIGALGAYTFRPRHFDAADVQMLGLLAAQVGPALEAARLYAESERRRAEAEALAELARQAAAAPDPARVIDAITEHACRLLEADYAAVAIEAEDGTYAWAGLRGNRTNGWREPPNQPSGRGAAERAIATGRTVVLERLGENPALPLDEFPRHRAEGGRTVLSTPLFGQRGALGALVLGWRTEVAITPAQVRLAEALASYAATILDSARSYAREEHLAREAAARAAELAAVFEQLPCGVTLVDAAGRVRLNNVASRGLWGQPPAPERPVPELAAYYLPRDAATGRVLAPGETTLGRALAGETVPRFEYLFRRPGADADTWVQSSAVPLRDEAGRITGAVGVFSDVTRERQLMRELAASEERLRLLYRSMACGVLVRDATGAIVDANEAAEEILGYTLAEMRGKLPDALWAVTDEHERELSSAERPSRVVLRTGAALRQLIMSVQRPNGQRRWIQNDAVPVRGPDGQLVQVISSFIDITAWKRAEAERTRLAAEVELERATLAAIMSSMSDGLVVLDATGQIRYHNERARALIGAPAGSLLGQSVEAAFASVRQLFADPRAAWAAWEQGAARLAEQPTFELKTVGPLAREITLQFFPVADLSEQGPGIGILLRDATDAKLLARLQERERIAMDLHDGVIQSLYAVALGLGARARALDGNVESTREALRKAVAHLNAVIQEIRNYIFDLRLGEQAARGVRAGLEVLAAELRINALVQPELTVEPAADRLPPEAAANLLQIAREATANVIRHAGATAVQITLRREGPALALTVRDNGRGFAPAPEGAEDAPGAGGQGLRNMAERARLLGGRLVVRSEPGQGTTVRVELPQGDPGGDEWPIRR